MNHDEAHIQAHEKAIAEMTGESYLLGDLSDAEADAFESHYFDCRVCSDTIRAGAAMFAAGQRVMNEPQPAPVPAPVPAPLPFRKRAPQWMAVAASVMLAFVVGRRLSVPVIPVMEFTNPAGTITSVVRGPEDEQIVIRFEGDRPVEIVAADTLDRDRGFPMYRLVLTDGSGKLLKAIDLTPKQALHADGVSVLLRALPAGRYVLAIQGVRKEGNPQHIAGKVIVVQ